MGTLLVIVLVVAVVAVGASYFFSSPEVPPATLDPSAPTPSRVPPGISEPTIAGPGDLDLVPIEQTTLEPAGEGATDQIVESSEAEAGSPDTQEAAGERPDMNSTPANDGTDDGITDAYFAKKVITKERTTEASTIYSYSFEFENTLTATNRSGIVTAIEGKANTALESEDRYVTTADVAAAVAGLENATYAAGFALPLPTKKIKDKEVYVRINSAPLESIVYVFAKTVNLDDKNVTITIFEKEPLLVDEDAPLPVLEVSGADGEEVDGPEITELIETVNEGTFVKKIKIRPQSDEDLQTWKDRMAGIEEEEEENGEPETGGQAEQAGDTQPAGNIPPPVQTYTVQSNDNLSAIASQYPGVSYQDIAARNGIPSPYNINPGQVLTIPVAGTGGEVPAGGENNQEGEEELTPVTVYLWLKATAEGDEESHEEEFLNANDEAYFRLGNTCNCDRDFTVVEMQEIIDTLRGEENATLFSASNCDIPTEDKTMALFTELLNETFETYGVTRCIRKIHFIAQAYHESDSLKTTEEYATEKVYAPFTGRGIMQLTWDIGYRAYSGHTGEDYYTNYEEIRSDIRNAIDSAGWFWQQGKQLNRNPSTWSPSGDGLGFTDRDDLSYTRTTMSYIYSGTTYRYGTVDLNDLADDDEGDLISYMVNGGGNGREERLDYIDELKEIF